ncbi:MAG TPA: hypothetical protein PLU72_11880 [Candidatus Ozemobacteraceae bacterium]|nr:hypothetical protein [Candidatus Ozemobacteraceae bacterium]
MNDQKPPAPPPDDIYRKLNVFRPVSDPNAPKKHPCPDCFSCQFCSDDRCAICLAGQKRRCCGACPSGAAGEPAPPAKEEPK